MWPFKSRRLNRAFLLGKRKQLLELKRAVALVEKEAEEAVREALLVAAEANRRLQDVLELNASMMEQNTVLLTELARFRLATRFEPRHTVH